MSERLRKFNLWSFFMRFIFYFIILRWLSRILFYASQDPIETLYVSIEGDFSNLLDAADEGVDKTKDKLEDLDDSGKKAGQGLKGSAGIAGVAFGLAAGAAGKLLDIVLSLAIAIPQFFANLGKEAVGANAQFETFATQFETLLGSGSAAQQRLEELAQFGVETPFELPEIVEASRTLQTFGGTVLATGDNLRMIGDIAAGVNQPFQSVAFWIGRMFDALQNGQPFGEASARLQEMGALTGDTRRQMERMQKAGEDGAAIFEAFSESVGGRFAGNMERLSATFQGVMSNLEDFRGNLLRVGGEPFFDEVRDSAIAFLDMLNENEDVITNIAKGVGELAAGVIRFVREGLGRFNVRPILEQIQKFVDWLGRISRGFQALISVGGQFTKSLAPIGNLIKWILGAAFDPLIKTLKFLWDGLKRVDEALVTGAKVLALSAAGWKGLFATLAPIGVVISKIGQAILALAKGDFARAGKLAGEALDQIKEGLFDVDAGIKAMEESLVESAVAIDKWTNPAEQMKEEIEGTPPAEIPEPELPSSDVIAEIADKYTNQLIDATEGRNERLEQLEQNHAEKLADILADGNEKRLDIEDKFNKSIAKLAGDGEKKRLKVIEDTRQKLAELAKNTDRELAQRRSEFDRDELRETEDHLREMRRLEEGFLLNLADAVRARDAGAIVDLQRKFQVQSKEREEDFQVKQGREGKDFDSSLDKVKENESRKRRELLEGQSRALEDIKLHEQEKRIELEIRRQEEIEKLNENLAQKLEREDENYMNRQAALDEALQKQLEAIAKSMADEKDVTEEGAREILETFNEYFGIGGNIDQIMEGFARRRKVRAEISVSFKKEELPTLSSDTSSGGAFGGRKRLGGVQEFAEGGTLVAEKPTLALFGESGPEVVQFTPMSQLSNPGGVDPQRMIVELTGSAPPGIGTSERDAIAAVLLSALQETGALS